MIHMQNWQFTHYTHKNKKALISLASAPNQAIFYSVSCINESYQEIYSQDFSKLHQALNLLNQKYGHWDLSVKASSSDSSGCSSCIAH